MHGKLTVWGTDLFGKWQYTITCFSYQIEDILADFKGYESYLFLFNK